MRLVTACGVLHPGGGRVHRWLDGGYAEVIEQRGQGGRWVQRLRPPGCPSWAVCWHSLQLCCFSQQRPVSPARPRPAATGILCAVLRWDQREVGGCEEDALWLGRRLCWQLQASSRAGRSEHRQLRSGWWAPVTPDLSLNHLPPSPCIQLPKILQVVLIFLIKAWSNKPRWREGGSVCLGAWALPVPSSVHTPLHHQGGQRPSWAEFQGDEAKWGQNANSV